MFRRKKIYIHSLLALCMVQQMYSVVFPAEMKQDMSKTNTSIEKEERYWFLPDVVMMQTAGYIGYVVGGLGYTFFNDHLEVIASYGYVPEHIGGIDIHTFAVKTSYYPFTLELHKNFELCPLYIGVTTLFALDDQLYWEWSTDCPDYYYPPTGAHAAINVGFQALICRQHAFFVELSMLDTYAKAYFWDDHEHFAFNECVTLALGYKFLFN